MEFYHSIQFLLFSEKSSLLEDASYASLSHDESYTIDFSNSKGVNAGKKEVEDRSKFRRGARVNAEVRRSIKLPKIVQGLQASRSVSPQFQSKMSEFALPSSGDEVSKLIAFRSQREELRKFVESCQSSLQKRPWSKVSRR